jgi:hypothetical protein
MSLVELGRFNRNEAMIIIGLLESEGVDAISFDGNASIADGSWFLIPVRVMVDESDLAKAEALLKKQA